MTLPDFSSSPASYSRYGPWMQSNRDPPRSNLASYHRTSGRILLRQASAEPSHPLVARQSRLVEF
jgi:hypothetical protein